jgi:hypothetical protein
VRYVLGACPATEDQDSFFPTAKYRAIHSWDPGDVEMLGGLRSARMKYGSCVGHLPSDIQESCD